LQKGRYCVTDGPALRIAIDKNNNGIIDDDDVQMGDIFKPLPAGDNILSGPSTTVNLLVECVSTVEFGPLIRLDIYVGAHPGTAGSRSTVPVEPRMYAPLNHGPPYDVPSNPSQIAYESRGKTYVKLEDNYWNGDFLGDTLGWAQIPGNTLTYSKTLATTIHLENYEVGKGVSGQRFFVRAFAIAAGDGNRQVADTYAFTNPIWILPGQASQPGIGNFPDNPVLDPGDSDPSNPTNPGTDGGSAGTNPPPAADPAASVPVAAAGRNLQGQIVINFTGTLQFSPKLGQPFIDISPGPGPFVISQSGQAGYFRSRK
jgi:hypothetical protein